MVYKLRFYIANVSINYKLQKKKWVKQIKLIKKLI